MYIQVTLSSLTHQVAFSTPNLPLSTRSLPQFCSLRGARRPVLRLRNQDRLLIVQRRGHGRHGLLSEKDKAISSKEALSSQIATAVELKQALSRIQVVRIRTTFSRTSGQTGGVELVSTKLDHFCFFSTIKDVTITKATGTKKE